MKRYLLCFCLMMKRMVKKPAFLLFLLILPILSVLITRLEQDTNARTGVMVGILLEDGAKGDQKGELEGGTENGVREQQAWNAYFLSLLTESDSVIQFQEYENRNAFFQDIQKGSLDCGAIFPADMQERIMIDEWRGSITIYETSSSSMTEIVKERIAAALFTLYSEESYVNYARHAEAFSTAREDEDKGIGRIDTEEIASFAYEAYESHLMDGSTFAFVYNGERYEQGEGESAGTADMEAAGVKTDDMEVADMETDSTETDGIKAGKQQPVENPSFQLRGILAVCIFLSGLCGLLTDWEDRQDGCFERILPRGVTTAVNIWVPTIYTSAAALLSYALTGELMGIGQDLCRLLLYQLLIVVYCCIIRLLLRKQETIAAAIPILTLTCMVCCPVWVRLAAYLSVFRILEKLFPVTYYLM